ncbi:CopG family transcriptional regulator [Algoriphagus hitonicola]|uniref:Ribbon-helix-helix domain-containing protein n=1 Tax=Algoriphagus hitonicola TaxID=435880 RepID=A0A1I2VDM5_9BACT|nr:CopG family transcriptional regulator [Algoriphagus hitonicola]SFG87455.1 hypothetical protein SAMN04487988_109155 [Algoriphagus hitonicola]
MATFTSSLPDDLLEKVSSEASKLSIPKNKLIEKALRAYLDYLKRLEYAKSYRMASKDPEVLEMAEEDMGEYFKQIEENEAR